MKATILAALIFGAFACGVLVGYRGNAYEHITRDIAVYERMKRGEDLLKRAYPILKECGEKL